MKHRRPPTYGIQVRAGRENWGWVLPSGVTVTENSVLSASWSGMDGYESACEAAETLRSRNPGLEFRVARKF